MLLKNNVWRQFPGLATATCIFVSYVAFDKLIPSFGGGGHHGHDDHGAGHGDHGAAAPKVRHVLLAPAAPASARTGARPGQRT